ncbi:hypothetical protein ACTQ9L_15625 [Deinococcus wulumuqiensis]
MTSSPSFADIPRAQLPDDDQLRVVDAIGPIDYTDALRPHLKVTLTTIVPTEDGFSRQGNPKVIDLHVADLIDIGPSQFIKARKPSRPHKGFLTRLTTELDMETATLQPLSDSPFLFDKQHGPYPKGTISFIGKLQCYSFCTPETTIIIPCLDIWRFFVGQSTSLLTLSTQAECKSRLEIMRRGSFLQTEAGDIYHLPLAKGDTDQHSEVIQSSTLHLHLDHPQQFNMAELPFLAWCMVDENIFNALIRFYGSIIATKKKAGTRGTTISHPQFGFPIKGAFKAKFGGHAMQVNGQSYFFVHRILSFMADIPMPKGISHPLGTSEGDADPLAA